MGVGCALWCEVSGPVKRTNVYFLAIFVKWDPLLRMFLTTLWPMCKSLCGGGVLTLKMKSWCLNFCIFCVLMCSVNQKSHFKLGTYRPIISDPFISVTKYTSNTKKYKMGSVEGPRYQGLWKIECAFSRNFLVKWNPLLKVFLTTLWPMCRAHV